VTGRTPPSAERPALTSELTGAELERWYWLKRELVEFARRAGISPTGGKLELIQRISAHLDDRPPPPRRAPQVSSAQLTPPLSDASRIPAGQRCSQAVRAWFVAEVDPRFHFDAAMRAFFAAADGTGTLADARAHWWSSRERQPDEIGPQFEYNHFTRAWHAAHPDGSPAQRRAAWLVHRSTPVDRRAIPPGDVAGETSGD